MKNLSEISKKKVLDLNLTLISKAELTQLEDNPSVSWVEMEGTNAFITVQDLKTLDEEQILLTVI